MSGEAGSIIMPQFTKIVVMIANEKSPWVKIAMATRRIGLKGSSNQTAFVAENLKMSFFFVIITNVWKR